MFFWDSMVSFTIVIDIFMLHGYSITFTEATVVGIRKTFP